MTRKTVLEHIISRFTKTCDHAPRQRVGGIHPATLYPLNNTGLRWIKLETIQVGGSLYTCLETLQRFFDRLSEAQSNGFKEQVK